MGIVTINWLKVLQVEMNRSSTWLAEQLNMSGTALSLKCTNGTKPLLDTLLIFQSC